jgi:hypothetical protein
LLSAVVITCWMTLLKLHMCLCFHEKIILFVNYKPLSFIL